MPRRPRRSSRRKGGGAHHRRRSRRQAILRRGSAEGDRQLRPARHPRQQCRRAAPRQGHRGHHRRAAAAHLPDQHLLDVLPDPGGAAASQEGRGDHQLHLGHDVPGLKELLDYSATKGAITAFTRSLSENLVEGRHPRERCRARSDLDPAQSFGGKPPEEIKDFGKDTPMGRPGHPMRWRPASCSSPARTASYMTGQVLHPNGGTIVNG